MNKKLIIFFLLLLLSPRLTFANDGMAGVLGFYVLCGLIAVIAIPIVAYFATLSVNNVKGKEYSPSNSAATAFVLSVSGVIFFIFYIIDAMKGS